MRVVLLALFVWLAAPSRSEACHNAITWDLDDVGRKIRRAEQLVSEGRTADAPRELRVAMSLLDRGSFGDYELVDHERRGRRASALRARADQLVAVIVVRRDGALDRRRMRAIDRVDRGTRAIQLGWALGVLRRGAARDADPVARARWAEALARVGVHAEAHRVLRDLSERDLMPDAWGYRVLAELDDRAGDDARRDLAVSRCLERAGEEHRFVCPRRVAVPM